MHCLRLFLRDESGATVVEYGLIATFVALIIISSFRTTGSRLSSKLLAISGNLS